MNKPADNANRPPADAQALRRTVIDGGYCVGCGACASVAQSPMQVTLNATGHLQASVTGSDTGAPVASVCPFADASVNEDEIGRAIFRAQHTQQSEHIGRYLNVYAGYVVEDGYRQRGSSGGMGSWILCELLKHGEVDAVVHVAQRTPTPNDPRLFAYTVSNTADAVRAGAKSRYYPVEISEAMATVRATPGRYAFVGVPCFVKAVRLLARQDPVLAERIRYCVAIFCGHLKTTRFGEYLAWQAGVKPEEFRDIDFRHKLPDAPANRYGIRVTAERDGKLEEVVKPVGKIYGTDWGLGFFKYKACDYCDDVVGETADIAVGDAWLPRYVQDSEGTNVVIVRNAQVAAMVEAAIADGRLHMDPLAAADITQSQSSGFDHRRRGLAYRLSHTDRKRRWRPRKRVQPDGRIGDWRFRLRHWLRMKLAAASHRAYDAARREGRIEGFRDRVKWWVRAYRFASKNTRKG
ncbi:MAG: coenzyme F420 hydrogenase [Planctomycetes bacterium]|nr:coenzyme F420 hydrogenase [Planctomycetota bacterium]